MDEMPDGFDLDALLAPIPGDMPAGVDFRSDPSPQSLYYRLRDARAEARAAERVIEGADPSDPSSSGEPPQWRTVRELGLEAIANHSKDLEIGAWLTEALLRCDGLTGFTAGVQLMIGLVERYWDDLFPQPDEDGISTRVAPVGGLNGQSSDGTLMPPLRKLTLFPRPDGAPLQFWQYEQSIDLAKIVDPERRQQRIDAGTVPFEALESEAIAAGTANFATLRQQAVEAGQAWRDLGDALDVRAGADSPATSRVRDLLDHIVEAATRFAGDNAGTPAADASAPAAPISGSTSAALGEIAVPAGALASREDALRNLAAIAEFFRRTEPLSPLSYTLQEAVRRARLSWPELLEEIVPDSTTRGQILTSLGIKPPPTE